MNDAPRVLGVDPGTVSFDVCGRQGDEVFLDGTFATAEVSARPELLVDALCASGPADLVVGPSGYGLPWMDIADLGPRELGLLLLADSVDGQRGSIVGGMGRMVAALAHSGLPVCFAPGVIHLASVPEHRKVNRIDMGTADKLCAVALGVWDQARRHLLEYDQTAFVYVELGGAFTAVIAVQDGAVVDGAGGSAGAMGYLAPGALDGELAYLMRDFPKDCLASGGVAYIAGAAGSAPGELAEAASGDRRAALAWEALFEDVVKHVAAEMTVLDAPREILLSGRLSRVPWVFEQLAPRLGRFAPVRRVEGYASKAGEAAQGAALVGQGLLGGPLSGLVAAMGLRSAAGTVLDHLYVDGTDDVRRRYRQSEPGPSPYWARR